ncbi:MAG TPA: M28 family peptidase [Candidatus Polarisedimenticolia bacterium]|nr:M28 family peptidase [Candidatus Polarisedimenticolia bacterium]
MPAGKTILGTTFAAALAAGSLPGSNAGGTPAAGIEEMLLATPDAASFSRHLALLTEEPHPAGSPRNMLLADYVRGKFVEYGLEDVRFHDTPALLSRPVSASIEILGSPGVRLKLAEDPEPADKDSRLYRDGRFVPYHAYAKSGDVTAEVVYANSGGPEDFAALDRMKIDVRGRIVLMRHSEPYSYRGYKIYLAESRGAAGCILYSDPIDDGSGRGEIYPRGPWGPPSHLQLGSIVYDWLGPGEPFTFHWKKRADGTWTEGKTRDRQLPKIPSIPISSEDAARILSRLSGSAVPAGWQGGLRFPYHTGPGPMKVRLRVENRERIGTMRNVLGFIRGDSEPDKWIVLGNHRDAWVYGAVDPSGGTAALLETARALGAALRTGHRPRRTIVFANWDAEEDLLGGSTSWVKDESERLRRDGVVYINVDEGAAGPQFGGGATPALADFLREATRAVPNPDGAGTLYDAWAARYRSGVPEVEEIVGATDYTAFQEHIGMSCIDLAYDGPYGVYHSQYDDYFWVSRIGDPGFRHNTTLARLWTLVAWRLATTQVLPMRYSDYARSIPASIARVEKMAADGAVPGDEMPPLRLSEARAASRRWLSAARKFESALERRQDSGSAISDETARAINDLLLQVERAMTEGEGLKGRPFFKHLIYAPQPTYRSEVLPRIFETIQAGDRESIPRYERQLVEAFDGAADLCRRARDLLSGDEAESSS